MCNSTMCTHNTFNNDNTNNNHKKKQKTFYHMPMDPEGPCNHFNNV